MLPCVMFYLSKYFEVPRLNYTKYKLSVRQTNNPATIQLSRITGPESIAYTWLNPLYNKRIFVISIYMGRKTEIKLPTSKALAQRLGVPSS
ncbi:Low-affinity potassium transport protein [Fusarium oxysporum f. sp. albedinis]|nr:Low-affinity potassium transport protein [Fusarium oxysporum f. sp. albedinis]